MSKKKIFIILAIVLVLLVGGFLMFRSTMQKVLYDPIENNSLGRPVLQYRMSLAKISHEKLDPALKKYYPQL